MKRKPEPTRSYDRRNRDLQMDLLRQRIVEATVALHAEKGTLATTYRDIAERAGVTVPTVYNHFPGKSQLFEACIGHAMAAAPDADTACITQPRALQQRLEALVALRVQGHEYFHPWLRWPEAVQLEELQPYRKLDAQRLDAWLELALKKNPATLPTARHKLIHVLLDYPTWDGLAREQGLGRDAIIQVLAKTILGLVKA